MRATILENPYIPNTPTPKQAYFLLLPHQEALYGGAAGGGKSDALLMAALQYVTVPGYAAILFRRTYTDFTLPDSLMDRAERWLTRAELGGDFTKVPGGIAPHWSEQKKKWTFPSGATLTFGYLEYEKHKYRYQSSAFHFIGFDELTQFNESQYRYLFSRKRKLKGVKIPTRIRGATNPGGIGHEWVKQRFIIEGGIIKRPFVPAFLKDNPYLDQEEYTESLMELDPLTRKQLLEGDWNAGIIGKLFRRGWFKIVDNIPEGSTKVRYWDLAATPVGDNPNPDYTVGLLLSKTPYGRYIIENITRFRARPAEVERIIRQTAEIDGIEVPIVMEQEPGSAGVNNIDNYRRNILNGYAFYEDKVTGKKIDRARAVSSQAEAKNIDIYRGAYITDFFDEIELFPDSTHKDQADCLSGSYNWLNNPKNQPFVEAVPIW